MVFSIYLQSGEGIGFMRISACYIVKNEAAVLARSIESLQGNVDELLVVDTGSTDDTVALARRYGAKVLQYTWQDDFAEARNFAIDQAKGDWIVFPDADEYFAADSGCRLRQVIEQNAQARALLIKRLDIDADRNDEVLAALFVLRAFQRRPELRFAGRIHEELRDRGGDIREAVYVPESELQLLHTGYSASVNRAKAERNLKLLLTELAETKQPGRLYGYLADAYFGLDDHEKAMRYAQLDIAQGRRPVTYASRSYRILLPLLAANPNRWQQRRQTAAQAAQTFPELAEFHAEYAECLAYAFDYEGALQEAGWALETFDAPAGIEASAFTAEQAALLHQRMTLWQCIAARMGSLKLTACAIVKNEAAEIGRWIENARVYADEILLVDTGSTDGTRDIAEQAGVRVLDFTWRDDFAAARNFMIEQAGGDWIVSPDADEYFAQPEHIRAFMAEMDVTQPQADAVMVISPNIDADCNNQEINRYPVVRIFRRSEGLRYVGNVHERLWRAQGEMNLFTEKYRVLLMHTGYSTKRVMRKIERNLALLQQDIRQNGEQPRHYSYLADCYFGRKEYDKNLHYALLAIDSPLQTVGVNSDMYQEALESMRELGYPLQEQLELAQRAIAAFPLLPDFYAYEGMILCADRQPGEGRQSLERARELFEEPRDQSGESTMAHNIMAKVYGRLGLLYELEGNAKMAEQNIRKALQLEKYNEEVLTQYADLCQQEKPEVFAASLAEFFSGERQDMEYLMRWAEKSGFAALYQYYAGQVQQRFGTRQELLELYALAERGEQEKLSDAVLGKAIVQVQQLFVSLLMLVDRSDMQELWERSLQMLPASLQQLLQRYHGGSERLTSSAADGFQSMLQAVLTWCGPEQLVRYVRLALDFDWQTVYKTAQKLYAEEKWEAAMVLYQEIPADSAVVTAVFWHDAGVCLYRLGQPEAAKECLENAKSLGAADRDIEAYLTWIGEAEA